MFSPDKFLVTEIIEEITDPLRAYVPFHPAVKSMSTPGGFRQNPSNLHDIQPIRPQTRCLVFDWLDLDRQRSCDASYTQLNFSSCPTQSMGATHWSYHHRGGKKEAEQMQFRRTREPRREETRKDLVIRRFRRSSGNSKPKAR